MGLRQKKVMEALWEGSIKFEIEDFDVDAPGVARLPGTTVLLIRSNFYMPARHGEKYGHQFLMLRWRGDAQVSIAPIEKLMEYW